MEGALKTGTTNYFSTTYNKITFSKNLIEKYP